MKYPKFFVLLLTLASTICFAQEETEQSNFIGEAKLEFVNNYYWRGAYEYPEGVPAFQPAVTLGFNDPSISVNIWSSLPLKQRTELKDDRDELDITLNYDLINQDEFTLSLGFVSYLFFIGEFWHSEEFYISAWHNVWNDFSVYAQAYIDVDAYKGLYFNFGPSYSRALSDKLSLDAKVLISFTKYDEQSFGFIETGILASLSYDLTKILSCAGGLLWNYNIESKNNQYAINLSLVAEW